MERKGIDHERYRKIQNDIDYVFKLARRNFSLVRSCIRIVQTQSRVIELINLPSFADETVGVEQLPTSEQVFGRPAPTVEFGPGARYRYWNRVSRAERVAALQALRQRLRMPGMSLLQNLNSMSASVSRASTEPASRDEVDMPHLLTAQSDTEDGEKAGDVEPAESVADSKDDDSLCLLTEFRDLRVRSVAFAYEPDGPLALNIQPPIADVSDGPLWAEESPLPSDMHIVPGKVYGLVGQNRSGKSTLVQVLCRLFHPDPSTTRIVFNGRVPLHRVARASLREIISYVSQRPFIFPGTIAENIRMARPDATDWEVECAAEAV
jgi:ABC-type multidrug transport system fused ATPase/permease subunit